MVTTESTGSNIDMSNIFQTSQANLSMEGILETAKNYVEWILEIDSKENSCYETLCFLTPRLFVPLLQIYNFKTIIV